MQCTMGRGMCRAFYGKSVQTEAGRDECRYCGFNLDELNRRLDDIRTNGLSDAGGGLREYRVKRPKRRRT